MPLLFEILTINISTACYRIADLDTDRLHDTISGHYIMVSLLHTVIVLVMIFTIASSAPVSNSDDLWPLGTERIEPVICYGELHVAKLAV